VVLIELESYSGWAITEPKSDFHFYMLPIL